MEVDVTPEFGEWAVGYSGCDGGNLKGEVWVCGIEYGGGVVESDLRFDPMLEPWCWPEESIDEALSYQYNRKLAKLYAAIKGEPVGMCMDVAKRDRIFQKDGPMFKLNLYPIAFKNASDELWEEWIYKKTGLPTKSLYRAWCQIHRFKAIRSWVAEYSPKLIIGTGRGYLSDFVLAFGGLECLYDGTGRTEKIGDRDLFIRSVNGGRTQLAVTPFLGNRHGLSSDAQLEDFGKAIRELLKR
jgi:hypothetical protein